MKPELYYLNHPTTLRTIAITSLTRVVSVIAPDFINHLCVILSAYPLHGTAMSILPFVTVLGLLLAALLVAIFKGSRPPQPIPSNPTAPKRAVFSAFVPVVCAAISYLILKSFDWYLTAHLAPPKQLIIPLRVGWFVGLIAPWFVGLYFVYGTARAASKVLRAIGALELLMCLFYGLALLFGSTIGFG